MKNNCFRQLLLLLVCMGAFISTYSQTKSVRGTVKDQDGKPLSGATVQVKSTQVSTATDDKGLFSLNMPDGHSIIVISYIGMAPQEVNAANGEPVSVTLRARSTVLQDMVVIGYGTSRRRDLTGAVGSVKGSDLIKGNPTNIVSALQGRVAGTVVTQSDGAPGAGLNIQIRGSNSFNMGSQPLYVIDGIPYVNGNSTVTPGTMSGSGEVSSVNALSFLNPADIESIDILKDASATAIYGSRGANGVVMITTKKGRTGRGKLELDVNTGISTVMRKIDVLNAHDYASMQNEAISNANYFEPGPTPRTLPFPGQSQPSPTDPDSLVYYPGPADFIGKSTDWQDMIFQTGIVNNYTLSASGADEKGSYMVSGNLINQQGIIQNSKFRQYSFRTNITRNVNKWLVIGTNTNFSQSTNQLVKTNNENLDGGVGVVKASLAFSPTLQLRDPVTNEFTAATQVSNPYVYVQDVKNQVLINQIFSANYLEATITKDLKFRQNIGISFFNNQREQYYPRTVFEGKAALGLAYQTQGWYTSMTYESLLSYNKLLGEHQVSAVGGFTYEDSRYTTKGQQASNFVSDLLQDNNMASGQNYTQPQTSKGQSNLMSFLARFNDSYKDRYLLTLSVRTDGSSKFARGNRWSLFPSGAFAWRLSEEPFMKGIKEVADEIKIRVGYGRTGNQGIGSYQTLTKLIPFPYTFNGTLANGYAADVWAGPGNIDLRWEETAQYNAGIDLAFFNNRLTFQGDVYYKRTSELLQNVTTPPSSGFTTQTINSGEVENKGLELTLGGSPVRTKNFSWDVSGNIAFNRNKILSLGGGVMQQFATRINTSGDQPFIQRVGQPIGALFGYQEEGIYRNEAEVRADPVMAHESDAIILRTIGEIRYRDLHKDGFITADDRTIIGNVTPKFTYGFSSNFTYKNFDASFLIQGSYGNDIINMNTYFLSNIGGFNNIPQYVYDGRWTFDNWENATWPKAEQQYWRKFNFTRRFLEDGSYLRLKNISLGYNVPLKSEFLQQLRVYASAVNVFTITRYKGYDPDVNGYGDDPAKRGVDMGGYPSARVFNFGFHATF